MNTEEGIAGNKLICDFMGVETKIISDWDGKNYLIDAVQSHRWAEGVLIIYHTSWDWQVPAWGKVALAVKNLIPYLEQSKIEDSFLWYVRLVSKYEEAIFQNKPEDGFKIICELLEWLNKKQGAQVSDTTKAQ